MDANFAEDQSLERDGNLNEVVSSEGKGPQVKGAFNLWDYFLELVLLFSKILLLLQNLKFALFAMAHDVY